MRKSRILMMLLAVFFFTSSFAPRGAARHEKEKKPFVSWAYVGYIECTGGTRVYVWKDFRPPYNNWGAGPIFCVTKTTLSSPYTAATGTYNGDGTVTGLSYTPVVGGASGCANGYSGPLQ